MNNHKIWYLGHGNYLEGEDAEIYVAFLNQEMKDLNIMISKQLQGIQEYLEGYTIKQSNDFIDLFENVMELGERCSTTAILLEELSNRIKERMESNE